MTDPGDDPYQAPYQAPLASEPLEPRLGPGWLLIFAVCVAGFCLLVSLSFGLVTLVNSDHYPRMWAIALLFSLPAIALGLYGLLRPTCYVHRVVSLADRAVFVVLLLAGSWLGIGNLGRLLSN